ncbi:hypothetical protein HN832_03020 [archaeon]|jgi:hypothetical protein|nr:hypothetical protein [archaeon]MBT4373326.1 hypothetical protein [archaeon]MBT4531671.1 hypothetical protein [archaeon]MBT7001151.1 hypothetical protein [archaeon]MBT7282363.1 hypothetical protein [archaeon]
MKIKVSHGRIIGIEEQDLNPVLPTTDLSFVEDKDLFREIRNYIKSEHQNIDYKLSFQDGVMKGSNPYLQIAVDMFLKNNYPNFRIARQRDLETDLEKFKGFYMDSGLVLRSKDNPNSAQAINLYNQLRARGLKDSEIFPMFIDLRGVELTKDLEFKLTDESTYKQADCLNWDSGTRYSQTDEVGLPKEKDLSGTRRIWTTNNGLRSFYLDSDLGAGSLDGDLSGSNGGGRCVVAGGRRSHEVAEQTNFLHNF